MFGNLVEPDSCSPRPSDDGVPADVVAEGVSRIRRADPSFDPSHFIEGARAAFEMIVAAFAKGDKAGLRPLLSDEVFQQFAAAIDERVAAKETLETRIDKLDAVDIAEAQLAGRTAQLTLKLVSHQINVTRAMDGSIVDGDPANPVEKTDYWTFARDTRSTDRTGCSSPQAAADATPRWRYGTRVSMAGAAGVVALLAVGVGRDSGPARFSLTATGFDRLRGWVDDQPSATLPAFLKSCARLLSRPDVTALDPVPHSADYGRVADWRNLCLAAEALPPGDDAAARDFFEVFFVPLAVADYGEPEGLFTGYFEIELNGSRRRHGRFQTPIYRRPPELGAGPFYSRAEIEDGALAGRGLELLWVDDPIDGFFLEIQGSGRVRLEDGSAVRVGYDGKNGLPYVPVGRLLVERGIMPRSQVTMIIIRDWMNEHPEAGAALRRENSSYVFFREQRDEGAIGAAGIVLTPERSLAVDRAYIALGLPIWLEAEERFAAAESVRRLVVAQDTGGAIKGPVRGDLFWGHRPCGGVGGPAT